MPAPPTATIMWKACVSGSLPDPPRSSDGGLDAAPDSVDAPAPDPSAAATRTPAETDPPTHPGPSRAFAVAALLCLGTALWLPWWQVGNVGPGGEVFERLTAAAFRPAGIASPALVHAASALAVAALLAVFVRVAGQSWRYEPHAWRRDLLLGAAAVAVAAVLVVASPQAYPAFWATILYETDNGDALVRTAPGLGWWLLWAGAASLAVAAGLARKADMAATAPTNDK